MKSFNTMLKRYGRDVSLHMDDGWSSNTFQASVQPLRYKNKLYLEGQHTGIGFTGDSCYLYLGPAEHELDKLPYSAYLKDSDGKKYYICRAEKVYVGKEVLYIWAILREIEESDYE